MDSKAGRELLGLRCMVLGSSSGIGQAVALELGQAGADVIIHGNSKPRAAAETAGRIRDLGSRSEVLLANLADRDALDDLGVRAWRLWDGLDAWLHLAGADTLTGEVAALGFDEKLDLLWSVDVVATLRLCRSIGARMKQQGHGAILTMGWDQAETGMEGDSGELFATIKGAIHSFTRSLSLTLAPEVRVNALAPGWIKTAWGATASERWQRRAIEEAPLRRWGTPEEIAGVARFLIGPSARFVTGQVVRVNGGAVR